MLQKVHFGQDRGHFIDDQRADPFRSGRRPLMYLLSRVHSEPWDLLMVV